MSETIPCELCGSAESREWFRGGDRLLGLPGTFTVARCLECGLVYTNPRPANLGDYYPESYGVYDPSGGQAIRMALYHRRIARKLHWQARIAAIAGIAAGAANGRPRILDIGCGEGTFLAEMKALGWEPTGLEMTASAAGRARQSRGLDVRVGAVEDADFEPNSFNLITLSHVLEHVSHPREVLRRLKPWLRPAGQLFVTLPNVDCWEQRLFGPDWYPWDLPRHLTHFSLETLSRLLEEEGFVAQHTSYLTGLFVPQSLRYRRKAQAERPQMADGGRDTGDRRPESEVGEPGTEDPAASPREFVKTAVFWSLLQTAALLGRFMKGEVLELVAICQER